MIKKQLRIVKIGGQLFEDEEKLRHFLLDFVALQGSKILIHGGGNMATTLAEKLGYETKMLDGRRITDENSLQVIVMTYAGWINKNIVARLQAMDCNSIGLCGADGQVIVSKMRKKEPVDFGFVGDIERVNSEFIKSLLRQEICPVFSAISCTAEGTLLNTNGDSVAAEIASAMSAYYETELYYLFSKKGVLKDINDENSVIPKINHINYEQLLSKKEILDGMLPKLQNCFAALDKGVKKIYLGDEQLLKNTGLYTEIIK